MAARERPGRLDPESMERGRRALARRDPVLAPVIRASGPCGLVVRGDPYGSLLRAILHQQLAGAAAAAIDRRFRAHFGGRYPAAARLLACDDATLRGLGLSRQKAAAMRSVAEAFGGGAVRARRLFHMSDDEVVEQLTQIRGVGEWTAHMIRMSSLGRPDVLPVGDYGIRKGAQILYGLDELPKPRALEAIAEPWRPWASVASWYLWRAVDLYEGS